jgi:hypothetical protein
MLLTLNIQTEILQLQKQIILSIVTFIDQHFSKIKNARNQLVLAIDVVVLITGCFFVSLHLISAKIFAETHQKVQHLIGLLSLKIC